MTVRATGGMSCSIALVAAVVGSLVWGWKGAVVCFAAMMLCALLEKPG